MASREPWPDIDLDDTMSEAARKTLLFHFEAMLANEAGTRAGDDIEALHDMRVATRRMRAACEVFGDFVDWRRIPTFRRGLRRVGRNLGRVRDLDVFWRKTQRYLERNPAAERLGLERLRAVWEAERGEARTRMIAYLDSARYARFTRQSVDFLQTPSAGELSPLLDDGEPRPRRVRHLVPVVIYRRVAEVRAYDEWVHQQNVPLSRLHQLRIASKALRDAAEFFRGVLSPAAEDLIGRVKALQDHLGDLNDALVASELLRDFMAWGTWGHPSAGAGQPIPPEPTTAAPGVASYLAARQEEIGRLLATFPEAWETLRSRDLDELVVAALSTVRGA